MNRSSENLVDEALNRLITAANTGLRQAPVRPNWAFASIQVLYWLTVCAPNPPECKPKPLRQSVEDVPNEQFATKKQKEKGNK